VSPHGGCWRGISLIRSLRVSIFPEQVRNLKVHKAGRAQTWVAQHRDKIELFFLPAYASEHNPDNARRRGKALLGSLVAALVT
jgi:hypothetical protein